MKLPQPLHAARLIKRYKRFLADAALEETGETVTAHLANPGSMMGLNQPGARIWLSWNDDPKRKLRYAWELIELPGGAWSGVSTAHPNRIVEEALRGGRVAEAAGYDRLRREVSYGAASRVDFLAEGDGLPPLFIEVKNVHLRRSGALAEFPDSVTKRGAKHLDELAAQVAAGARALMLYLVQRDDCEAFALAGDIDPAYLRRYHEARAAGVEAVAYACRIDPPPDADAAITLDRALPIREAAMRAS
ncbi:MAG: DNA/RNA nuclease SfsA [Pseudomonadota bacterium]